MVQLSRRFFLGGAIALIAAETFKPSFAAMGNMPTIYGDGIKNDSYGFSALFRNDPVIFSKDQIAVESHKGIVFYRGLFVIDETVEIPANTKIEFLKLAPVVFVGKNLDDDSSFFKCEVDVAEQFNGVSTFDVKKSHKAHLIDSYLKYDMELL